MPSLTNNLTNGKCQSQDRIGHLHVILNDHARVVDNDYDMPREVDSNVRPVVM